MRTLTGRKGAGTSAYWTECKYCGHVIWIVKGG